MTSPGGRRGRFRIQLEVDNESSLPRLLEGRTIALLGNALNTLTAEAWEPDAPVDSASGAAARQDDDGASPPAPAESALPADQPSPPEQDGEEERELTRHKCILRRHLRLAARERLEEARPAGVNGVRTPPAGLPEGCDPETEARYDGLIARPPREEDDEESSSSSSEEDEDAADATANEAASAANAGAAARRRGGAEPAPAAAAQRQSSSSSAGGGRQFTHALISGPKAGAGGRKGGDGPLDASSNSRKRPAASRSSDGGAGRSAERGGKRRKRAKSGRSIPLFSSRLLLDFSGGAPSLVVERAGRPTRPVRPRRVGRGGERSGGGKEGRPPRRCAHCKNSATQYRVCNFWNVTGNKCARAYCSACLLTQWSICHDVREELFNPNGTEWHELVGDARYDAEWHCPPCLERVAREEIASVTGNRGERKSSRRRGL
mmetsp:Transcript_5729/g.13290  ORF Transcript_5729/g.13290 Transcript_5729/m.13290 type:complete len:435 (+) Transcript_5729:257-1561(+)